MARQKLVVLWADFANAIQRLLRPKINTIWWLDKGFIDSKMGSMFSFWNVVNNVLFMI